MSKGDIVEIVDMDKKDKWLVRNKRNLNQVCNRTRSSHPDTGRHSCIRSDRFVTSRLIIWKNFLKRIRD